MRSRFLRFAWISSIALIVAGIVLAIVFPQPFITYYCSAYACPTESSGGYSFGYVVIFLGLVAAVVAAVASVANVLRRRAGAR